MSETPTNAPPAAVVAAPAPESLRDPAAQLWAQVEELPSRLSVELRVPRFTVRELYHLDVNSIVDSCWPQSADVPILANDILVGWVEFEVVGDRLAARLTELR